MAATYDPLQPTPKDRIRALLGDTAVTPGTTDIPAGDELHGDEHIAAVLAREGSEQRATAWLALELVAQFSQEPIKVSLSGNSFDFSSRIPAWEALAAPLRADLAQQAVQPAGGAQSRPYVGQIKAGSTYKVR